VWVIYSLDMNQNTYVLCFNEVFYVPKLLQGQRRLGEPVMQLAPKMISSNKNDELLQLDAAISSY